MKSGKDIRTAELVQDAEMSRLLSNQPARLGGYIPMRSCCLGLVFLVVRHEAGSFALVSCALIN